MGKIKNNNQENSNTIKDLGELLRRVPATSLGIMVDKGNDSQMALIQVSEVF